MVEVVRYIEACISGNIPRPFAQYHKHTTLINVLHNVHLCLYHAYCLAYSPSKSILLDDFYSAQGNVFQRSVHQKATGGKTFQVLII